MPSNTNNLELYKPDAGETGVADELNQNWSTIDTQFDRAAGHIHNGQVGQGPKIPVTSINASGVASAETFLRGDGSWQAGGSGEPGPPGPPGASNAVYTEFWSWNNQTSLPPNNAQLRTDTGDWATATLLRFDRNVLDNRDVSAALEHIVAGNEIRVQHRTDATRHGYFTVTGPHVPYASYVEFPVTVSEDVGVIPNSGTEVSVSVLIEGSTAAQWHTGPAAPAATLGHVGDMYLEGDGDVWQLDESTGWATTGTNIKGPAGATGATGPAGPAGPAGSTTLDGLTDTTITTPAAGHVLQYQAASSQWVNAPLAADALAGAVDGAYLPYHVVIWTAITQASGSYVWDLPLSAITHPIRAVDLSLYGNNNVAGGTLEIINPSYIMSRVMISATSLAGTPSFSNALVLLPASRQLTITVTGTWTSLYLSILAVIKGAPV